MINENRLRKAMEEIVAKKGEFTLFALLMRANAPSGKWDLVVSAPWLKGGELKATGEFVRLLTQSIGQKSLQQFARVLALGSDDARVQPILEKIVGDRPVEDRPLRVQSTDLLGLRIQEAIVFRAKKPRPSPRRAA